MLARLRELTPNLPPAPSRMIPTDDGHPIIYANAIGVVEALLFRSERLSIVHIDFPASSVAIRHKHAVPQALIVARGSISVDVGGSAVLVDVGGCVTLDAHVEHEVLALEETDLISVLGVECKGGFDA